MADEQDALKDEVKVIKEALAANSAQDVSLDQPYPQDIETTPRPVLDSPMPAAETPSTDAPPPDADPASGADQAKEQDKSSEKESNEKESSEKPEEQKEAKQEEKKPEDPAEKPGESQEGSDPTTIAGYTPADLLEAPVKPPEPAVTDSKKAIRHPNVKFLIIIGIVLFIIGVLLILFVDAIFGGLTIFFAALAIIAAVFLPVHKLNFPFKKAKTKASEK